ncbi:WecB/TagA/CpsF family glycosyltransferase [bacterium]|nr:WecB/TagA/CpsF family glycosyltransferase [bacterium]
MNTEPVHLIPRTNILGVNVCAVNPAQVLQIVDQQLEINRPHYICVTGVHGIMESFRDHSIKRIHNHADLVVPDEMSLVWLNWLHGRRQARLVYGPDLMRDLCEHSPKKGYRHFFYGGRKGIAQKLADRMQKRFPDLQIAGTFTPPFRPLTESEREKLFNRIENSEADIIWVGLSTPKQEIWLAEMQQHLTQGVMIGVGAAFDFHTGTISQAPKWMQLIGMDWFYRLLKEPGRFAKSYQAHHPQFLYYIALQLLGIRNFTPDEDSWQ